MSGDHESRPIPIRASDAERERSIALLRDAVSRRVRGAPGLLLASGSWWTVVAAASLLVAFDLRHDRPRPA
jgi:hypothetical protein